MASLNLLFVHEVSYEKKPIFEMQEFPEHLAAKGHRVSFLQFDEGFKFWQGNRQPRTKTIAGRVLTETSINIITPHQFGVPGLDRLYATVSVWPVLDRLLKNEKFDAIVLYAVPTYGHQVIQLAKKYGVPVVFRALDVSHLIRKSVFSPLIKSAEKYVYNHADVLSANNSALAAYCNALGHRNRETVVNLPPLDLQHFKVDAKDVSLQKSLGIKRGEKCVLYMGSFFHFSGLEQVIHDFAKSMDLFPKVKLMLVGGGSAAPSLIKLSQKLGLGDRVIFTGFVGYQDLPTYLRLADVAINPMHVVPASDLALPHKVLQYLACGVPVVTTRLSGLSETLNRSSGVLFVEASSDVWVGSMSVLYEAKLKTHPKLVLASHNAVDEFESLLAEL